MKKKAIIILILIITSSFIGYKYIYKDHRDIKNEKAEFTIKAADILYKFSTNPIDSNIDYLNKTIEVFGEISEYSANEITISNSVFCQLTDSINTELLINSKIKIKGRVIGYDDLLEQVKLDQCTIIN
jgi:hypothetical protein